MNYLLKILYNLLLLPLASFRLIYKSYYDKSYLKYVKERYGFCNTKDISKYIHNTDILIHVVSLGEFIASEKLICSLLSKYPKYNIVVTCTTPTARAKIDSKFNYNQVFCCYLPYDNYYIINKFIKKLSPKITIFVEKEIWPNLYSALKKVNSKIIIINATLNIKSFNNYNKIHKLIAKSINQVDYICAQSSDDLNNFVKLGYDKDNIAVYGNIKYDLDYPTDLDYESNIYKKKLALDDRLVIIAASTHADEEDIILKTFIKLKQKNNNLLLILVPRHPHRFDEIYELSKKYNLHTGRYSKLQGATETLDVFLLDTIGKLLYFYNLSDIAFVGGSLVPNIGCHNILEPAMFKLPIVIGNNYFNYKDIITRFNNNFGINIAENNIDLDNIFLKLLNNKELRLQQGNTAFNEFKKGQGALEKTLKKLEFLLKTT
tara:strand:+ start:22081 stop:23376 length:1296 start_codon:yes stop_codon:yes gene_type:complete